MQINMELRYLVLLIIKILISIPSTIIIIPGIHGASLMGGHLNNTVTGATTKIAENGTNVQRYDDYEYENEEEETPNASALILPGYNLPETIFNKGKPFYLEKDPLTGQVNFDSKPNGDEFEYLDVASTSDIYAKANLDRNDAHFESHHSSSDVNQLSPNFHDFLNLPVKYSSDKYVYPLISNSYANTKIQGNVQQYHNHKAGLVTTFRPITKPPSQSKLPYLPKTSHESTSPSAVTQPIFITTSASTVSPLMHYPGVNDVIVQEIKPSKNNIHLSEKAHTTSSPTTTKRPLSFFEQLFGDYEEVTTSELPKTSSHWLSTNQSVDNSSQSVSNIRDTAHDKLGNILTDSAIENSYEYEDYDEDTIKNTMYSSTTETVVETSTTKDMNDSIVLKLSSTPPTTMTSKKLITPPTLTTKVTSLPLGDNHFIKPSIITISSSSLRERLDHEKLRPRPFEATSHNLNNIHLAADQDTVSFVIGNQQSVSGSESETNTNTNTNSNSFRPLLTETDDLQDSVSYTVHAKPEYIPSPGVASEPGNPFNVGGSSVNLQPIKNSEAALSIGVPINGIKTIPGQVMDDDLEDSIKFPKRTVSKIAFPTDLDQRITTASSVVNRDILQLNSQPMYHQLPSELTPPRESEIPSTRLERPRPPWDPRPGHFHNGKIEYSRPPRPGSSNSPTKRIDNNLPNILPQFRPNTKIPPILDAKLHPRQPLLDRPNNRPIEFYNKLTPPPLPKHLQHVRKVANLELEINTRQKQQDENKNAHQQFTYFPTPPNVIVAEIKNQQASDESEVETLQMLQAKKIDKKESPTASFKTNLKGKDTTEKPLYVVYPVNSATVNADTTDAGKKGTVVIGTRSELPLPPPQIHHEFNYAILKDRTDAPILKPHLKLTFPIKSDFPYPMEKPNISTGFPVVYNSNRLDDLKMPTNNNQWDSVEEPRPTISYQSAQPANNHQISATLKTFTEKPIAIAYTPTEPHRQLVEKNDKYSMPNYAGPVISEIVTGQKGNSEITVSAVMHTHSQQHTQQQQQQQQQAAAPLNIQYPIPNHRIEENITHHNPLMQQNFQAPFQASVNLDRMSQGWTVVKNTPSIDRADHEESATLATMASTSEFDIENFKPQLFGGFQPIYSKDEKPGDPTTITDRQE